MALGSTNISRKPLGNLSAQMHLKHVRSARTVIIFVAILTLAIGGFFLYLNNEASIKMETQIQAIKNDPTQVLDENLVAQARGELLTGKIFSGIMVALGMTFFGLFFWAATKPFEACRLALILYATNFGLNMIINVIDAAGNKSGKPNFNLCSILIPILIMIALKKGMDSGKAYKEVLAADERRLAREAEAALNPPPPDGTPPAPPVPPANPAA